MFLQIRIQFFLKAFLELNALFRVMFGFDLLYTTNYSIETEDNFWNKLQGVIYNYLVCFLKYGIIYEN